MIDYTCVGGMGSSGALANEKLTGAGAPLIRSGCALIGRRARNGGGAVSPALWSLLLLVAFGLRLRQAVLRCVDAGLQRVVSPGRNYRHGDVVDESAVLRLLHRLLVVVRCHVPSFP